MNKLVISCRQTQKCLVFYSYFNGNMLRSFPPSSGRCSPSHHHLAVAVLPTIIWPLRSFPPSSGRCGPSHHHPALAVLPTIIRPLRSFPPSSGRCSPSHHHPAVAVLPTIIWPSYTNVTHVHTVQPCTKGSHNSYSYMKYV